MYRDRVAIAGNHRASYDDLFEGSTLVVEFAYQKIICLNETFDHSNKDRFDHLYKLEEKGKQIIHLNSYKRIMCKRNPPLSRYLLEKQK